MLQNIGMLKYDNSSCIILQNEVRICNILTVPHLISSEPNESED